MFFIYLEFALFVCLEIASCWRRKFWNYLFISATRLMTDDGYLHCRKGCGSKFRNVMPLDRHESVCTGPSNMAVDPLEMPPTLNRPLKFTVLKLPFKAKNKRGRGRPPRPRLLAIKPDGQQVDTDGRLTRQLVPKKMEDMTWIRFQI